MTGRQDRKTGENWTMGHSIKFWGESNPFKTKWQVENLTGLLLGRDENETPLLYFGTRSPPTIGFDVELRLETALRTGNWYSLGITAWVPKTWYTESEFNAYSEKAFQYWTGKLQISSDSSSPGFDSQELFDARVAEAIEEERLTSEQREDPEPIRVLQQETLEELRKGKTFRTAHHEGGSVIGFDGRNFFYSTYGEEESLKAFTSEDEMLDFIRQFYDWESHKETYPHKPPELDVWRFIKSQLIG